MQTRAGFTLFALLGGLALAGVALFALSGAALPPRVVRGIPVETRFVDETGDPLGLAVIRVLCYPTDSAPRPGADLLLTTGSDGRPDRELPEGCAYVAALRLLHTQPSGLPGHGHAYRVYHTSWPPGTRQLQAAAGDVEIHSEWPLVLFDVVASLAWETAPGSSFPAELLAGMRQASAYLYDLTEGQMALGRVALQAGGRGWQAADLRFLAANDYRPAVYVGGIVAARTPYTTTSGVETVFVPGNVFLGRYWDGLDASDPAAGAWSQAEAYRTLVHEWAHYALFLYDEYQSADLDGRTETYCTCLDLPLVGSTPGACGGVSPELAASAMAYHYTAGELWSSGLPPECGATDQWQVHGEQDWSTLGGWGAIQGLPDEWLQPPSSPEAGPALGLVGDLFLRTPGQYIFLPLTGRSGSPPDPVADITLQLALEGGASQETLAALTPQVYHIGQATDGSPERALYQGTSSGDRPPPGGLGEITLLGVRAGDHARVFLDRYAPEGAAGLRYVYPPRGAADPPLSAGSALALVTDTWRADLDLSFEMDGALLAVMTVTLSGPDPLSSGPVARLCTPEATLGCPESPRWRRLMDAADGLAWTAVFTGTLTDPLPHYGLLRIQVAGLGELDRWYQVAGGVGPAHIDAEAPLREGPIMVDSHDPLTGAENRVVVMPAASYAAITATLPAGIGGIVGVPLDVDVLLPGGLAGVSLSGAGFGDRFLPSPVVLTLFYSQEAVDRLGLAEGQLRLLHFSRRTGVWAVVPTSGSSAVLNWLATSPVQEDGIYAVGWEPLPGP